MVQNYEVISTKFLLNEKFQKQQTLICCSELTES